MKILTNAEIGTRMEEIARAIVPAVVFVYTLGVMIRQWYTRITTTVAAAHAAWIGDDWRFDQPDAPAPPAPAAPAEPAPFSRLPEIPRVIREQIQAAAAAPPAPKPVVKATVHKAPLTVEALMAAHTQRELMEMAGTKSKRSKKQLAERILSK